VDQLIGLLKQSETSWRVRAKVLPVLQVFYFRHLFQLDSATMIRVMDVVSELLLDSQIEVSSFFCYFVYSFMILQGKEDLNIYVFNITNASYYLV